MIRQSSPVRRAPRSGHLDLPDMGIFIPLRHSLVAMAKHDPRFFRGRAYEPTRARTLGPRHASPKNDGGQWASSIGPAKAQFRLCFTLILTEGVFEPQKGQLQVVRCDIPRELPSWSSRRVRGPPHESRFGPEGTRTTVDQTSVKPYR